MPFYRRRSYRRSSRVRAIGGTRVQRSSVRKEFPKFAVKRGPLLKQIHFTPSTTTDQSHLVFASNVSPSWANINVVVPMPNVPAAAWSCIHVSAIDQGTAIYQREGLSVMNRSLLIRGVLGFRGLTEDGTPPADVYGCGRGELLLIYDREPPQGATSVPPLGDFLEFAPSYYSPMRLDNRDRFDVLLRKKISVPLDALGGGSFMPTRFQMIDLKVPINRVTTFKSLSTVVASPGDVRKGALYLYFLGGNANTVPAAMTFLGFIKLAFTDLD